MSYTKRGPFVDASPTGPYLDHNWFDAVEVSLAATATGYTVDGATPGIDWTGTTDSAAALNAVLASPPQGSYANVIVRPPGGKGTIRIDSTITVDIARAGFIAPGGGLTLDASHMTVGAAMQVTATANVPNNSSVGGPTLGYFRLKGPGRYTTGTIGIRFSTSGIELRAFETHSVTVEEFGVGHQLNAGVYCFQNYNANLKGNGVSLWGAPDTGAYERVVYHGSTISDSPVGVKWESSGYGDLYLVNCSIDYCTTNQLVVTAGVVNLIGCHVEKSIVADNPWFEISGSGSVHMTGGQVLAGSGTYDPAHNPAYIVHTTTDPGYGVAAIFDGVFFSNTRTSTDLLAGGGGNVIVRNALFNGSTTRAFLGTSAENNLLANGNFEGANLFDFWYLGGDTGTILDSNNTATTVAGTNVSAAMSTDVAHAGTKSLKITKVGAAGTTASVAVAVPIGRLSTPQIIGYVARHAALTGSFSVTALFGTMRTTAGRTQQGRSQQQFASTYSTTTDLTAADTWLQFHSPSQTQRAPAWATHLILYFDVTAMGAGSLYLDDLLVTDI